MGAKRYNFKQVDFIFGSIIVTGFADGDDAISVEHNQDSFTFEPANDGSGTRSATNDNSARVTIKLQQQSLANGLLQAVLNSDKVSGAGVLPLTIKDRSGNSLHFAETAWIVRQPNSSYGRASGMREWIFETDDMVSNEGGSSV